MKGQEKEIVTDWKKYERQNETKNKNIMKSIKLFNLALLTFIIFSCNSDDINDSPISILGTWKPIAEVGVCSTGSEDISEYSICEQRSRFIFDADGTYAYEEYYLSNNQCESYDFENGTWEISNAKLFIDNDEATFFELSANNLKIGQYYNDPYDTCDGGQLLSHLYTEYVRVE